jgi:hypothetical protein
MNTTQNLTHIEPDFYIQIEELEDKLTDSYSQDIEQYISKLKTSDLASLNKNHLNFMFCHFFSKEGCSQENIYYKDIEKYKQNAINATEMNCLQALSMKHLFYNINELSTEFSEDSQVQVNNFLKHKLKRSYLSCEVTRSVFKPRLCDEAGKCCFNT